MRRSSLRSRDATQSTIDVLERWSRSWLREHHNWYETCCAHLRFSEVMQDRVRGVVSMKQIADVAQLACVPRSTARRKQTISSLSQPQFEPRQSRVNAGDLIPTEIHERNDLRRPPYREWNSQILWLVPLEPPSRVRGDARSRDQIRRSAARAEARQVDARSAAACTGASCERIGITPHRFTREQRPRRLARCEY